MEAIFPRDIVLQEVSNERYIEIPEEVRQIYRMWRPTPLYRAYGLEKALDTPAQIYYKYEGASPAGSHKPNTAVAQAFYNKIAGVKRLSTETGAGQWGSALAFGCRLFSLECMVYMVRVSYEQKPYRRSMMCTWGADVIPSPSNLTEAGRKILAEDPESPGSLGIAISEAVEDAVSRNDTKYALGSVLNHVLLHQTVIGLETQTQLEKMDIYPDIVIGCHGGGSNLGGIGLPFVRDKMKGKNVRVIAAEPQSCPSLTQGVYAYDYGDTAGFTPLMKMYTLGHDFVPPGIYAGGLRYHGASPIISLLVNEGLIEPMALGQVEVFEAALTFARSEGIIPAPESAHAIEAAIKEALKCKQEGISRTIVFCLSGHGHFDMGAYDAYFSGKLDDVKYDSDKSKDAIDRLPSIE